MLHRYLFTFSEELLQITVLAASLFGVLILSMHQEPLLIFEQKLGHPEVSAVQAWHNHFYVTTSNAMKWLDGFSFFAAIF